MKVRLWWLFLLTLSGSVLWAETISDRRIPKPQSQDVGSDAKGPEVQSPPPVTTDEIQLPQNAPVASETVPTPEAAPPEATLEVEDGFPQFAHDGSARIPSGDGKSLRCPSEKKRFPFIVALNSWIVEKNPRVDWKGKKIPYSDFVFYVDRSNGKYFAEAKSLDAFRQMVLEEVGVVGKNDNAAWIYFEGKTPNFEDQAQLKQQLQATKDSLKFFDVIHTHLLKGTKFRIETISTSGLWFVNNVRSEDFERLEKVYEPGGEETLESKTDQTKQVIAQTLFDSFLVPTLKASKGAMKLTKKQEQTVALFSKCAASAPSTDPEPKAMLIEKPAPSQAEAKDPESSSEETPVVKGPAPEVAPPTAVAPVAPPPLLEKPEEPDRSNSSVSPPLSAQPL
jgi:hypothetical protein